MQILLNSKRKSPPLFSRLLNKIQSGLNTRLYFGKHPASVPKYSVILFPCPDNLLNCGLVGIVYVKKDKAINEAYPEFQMPDFGQIAAKINEHAYAQCIQKSLPLTSLYLGGDQTVKELMASVRALKHINAFQTIYNDPVSQGQLQSLSSTLKALIDKESETLYQAMGHLSALDVEIISNRLETLKDAQWILNADLTQNIKKIKSLANDKDLQLNTSALTTLKNINSVLNSIDRLEVRGRDSAGISLLFTIDSETYDHFKAQIDQQSLQKELNTRQNPEVLQNKSISVKTTVDDDSVQKVAIAFTYKVAAEIGRLGDNVSFIRQQITEDDLLHTLITLPHAYHTVSAHTRWASVGAINESNCHPLDNKVLPDTIESDGIIHVCLNGDIDNFQELKQSYEKQGIFLPDDITCDTKIIPVHIETFLKKGHPINEAFRLAVNDFEGSHAISMHSDLAPGKLFLSLKGSGQTIFIGLADDHYITASEIYGLVEETTEFIKMDGDALNPSTTDVAVNGQIFMLDQASNGGIDGISAMSYDGSPIAIGPDLIRKTPLTSRDIDRQDFDHYFLKEISESPASVRKTIENRWKIEGTDNQRFIISLNEQVVPEKIKSAFKTNQIKRIIFIGQGTAGVAALACADIMRFYLSDLDIVVESLKSSELSGFRLNNDDADQFNDTLLIPISQSGTTADTNRTVDMVKRQGACSIAIVNRRDSDLSFKVDGVLYTSSGRDIEMSVASTKAFYSQIIAGTLLGLYFAQMTAQRSSAFISNEIKQMIELPTHMEKVLSMKEQIQASAQRNATSRTYWAAVGSGPNKAAADEIRIKLSELCYKTISSDFVEDKKHIDLSSEPLIFVCAAGTRRSVIGDIVKDTAIFHSHKALPIVIADEHEDRFDPYSNDIIHVPSVSEHFAPILNTLVGHLWGYYAALAINDGSRFLYDFRQDLQDTIESFTKDNLDIYEIALEKSFREKIILFYHDFRKQQEENKISATIGVKDSTNLVLLLKYLGGKLPLTDFELDFGIKGTAANMFNKLFESLGDAINCLARPVDAIKHQAKTVTVGTSRIEEKTDGLVFDFLKSKNFTLAQLSISNIMVIKNLQNIISKINGSTLYRISGINLLGEPTEDTTIELIEKTGSSASMISRAEQDKRLKGTKKIIVRRGNVYIGKGRKDNRSILVVPLISDDPSRPNTIEFLMLLDIVFSMDVTIASKVKALGGKHEHIKNLVQETNIAWEDKFLELVDMAELFGWSAEKVAESIIEKLS
ncbi:MAG: SIS domain-containing protein [Desulfobacteraceae bacterium]|jgi:glucosamine--fructose-6-phosphate aminotransferase (isomerizing)|nr:SIS domain-containing protein [Desulfobacteraceae bacterium]